MEADQRASRCVLCRLLGGWKDDRGGGLGSNLHVNERRGDLDSDECPQHQLARYRMLGRRDEDRGYHGLRNRVPLPLHQFWIDLAGHDLAGWI